MVTTTQDSADLARLWLGEQQRRILDALEATVLHTGGLLVLSGDPGVGKTTLAKALIAQLAAHAIVARLPRPTADAPTMLEALGRGLGVDVSDRSRATFVHSVRELIDDAAGQDRRVLIVVDEAHDLTQDALAELEHLLSPDLSGLQPHLGVLLVGQEELPALLEEPRSHLQRFVTLSERVPTLSAAEVESFVRHRLVVSGVDPALFKDDAFGAIGVMSAGIPRLVVRLCDVALIGRAPNKRIDARTVRERAERFGVLPRMPMMPAPDQTSNAPAIWAGTRIRASMLRDLVRPGLVALVVAVGIAAVYAVASHGLRGARLTPDAAARIVSREHVGTGSIPTAPAESVARPSLPVDSTSKPRSLESPPTRLAENAQRSATAPGPIGSAPRARQPDAVPDSTTTPRSIASPPRVVAEKEMIAPRAADSARRSRAAEQPPALLTAPAESRAIRPGDIGAPSPAAQGSPVPKAAAVPRTASSPRVPAQKNTIAPDRAGGSPAAARPPTLLTAPAAPRASSSAPTGAVPSAVQPEAAPASTATLGSTAAPPRASAPTATIAPAEARSSAGSATAPDPGAIIDWLLKEAPGRR